MGTMKMKTRPLTVPVMAAIVLAIPALCWAKTELLDWRDMEPGKLRVGYLKVERPVALQIKAVATIGARENELIAYPWIVDSETRKAVWILEADKAKKDAKPNSKEGTVRVKQEGTVQLEPGSYEVYFTTVGDARRVKISTWFGLNVGKKTSVRQIAAPRPDDWRLTLTVEDKDKNAISAGDRHRPSFSPLLRTGEVKRSESQRLPFRLDAASSVVVYAIGEYDKMNRTLADGAWIERGSDRDIVWKMTEDNTRYAGGAEKNRMFRDTVALEPGVYILCYSSDDSHGPGDWNMNPPLDPDFWGAAIFDFRGARAHFTAGVEDPIMRNRIVDLSRQRNDEFAMGGLRVKRPITVRIYAIGEAADKRFVDRGWIEEARTHRLLWSMSYGETEPAGGASKNREARAELSLPVGDYLVYNITDGSHAFGSWNATPPRDPEGWGIQVWGAGDSFEAKSVERYNSEQDPLILGQLIQIRDSSDAVEKFTIKKKTRVRIIAVGEGLHGQMFDYGWLERTDDGTGEYVWRMRYERTTPAGGDEKNRRATEEIELDPGAYELHYVTDDSHAFGDWNAWPPDQPHLWGISVTQIK